MNKNNRLEIAQETLKIIENGYYFVNENKIDVSQEIKNNIDNTFTISPNDWTDIVSKSIKENDDQSVIEVKNCSSIEAIVSESSLKVGVLNFASAKNPGGGFLGGASAQEESLARSSSLYSSLIKD
ncbi:MAG: TIGR02452 family protein, partial [Flavobacteriaceae bacterium]|nr:TIGR02452 family protein [Flavobacteriaceae bacterium]